MRRIHIVLLVLIALSVCVIVSSFVDFSTYETFGSAAQQPGKSFLVMGMLQKNMAMDYEPLKDANHFIFFAKDKAGTVNKVIFNGEKPRDIEKSEKIVMTGYEDKGVFHCAKIQMKCPSKYKKDMVVTAGVQ